MPVNDFLPFCPTDSGTNLIEQAAYVTSNGRTQGNQPGVASSALVNKALRQATYMVSGIAQFIANALNQDVKDDANAPELLAQIQSALQIPSGTVTMYAGNTAPAGWLMCDGSAVSRTTYAALFSAIGSGAIWGTGDGTTTFNLPNTQGLFVRGSGTQTVAGKSFTGTLGASSADTTAMNGMYVADPTHNHVIYTVGNAGGGGYAGLNTTINYGSSQPAGYSNGGGVPFIQGSYTGVYLAGGGTETTPGNVGMNYIVKV